MAKNLWKPWITQGTYACEHHMKEKLQELKKGKNRLYCTFCGAWWKTHPKRGVKSHKVST